MQKNNQVSLFPLLYEILSFCVMVFIFAVSFYAIVNHLNNFPFHFELPFFEKILSNLPF